MPAAVQSRYGPPETLTVTQIPIPTPANGEVLVRVHAAAVSPADCAFRKGRPYATRAMNGLRRPKHVLGSELAGEVVQLGPGVDHLAIGDRVFGSTGPTFGAHADYTAVPVNEIATIPDELDYDDAVAIVDGGLTAWVFLHLGAKLTAGQRILVNGASGAVGIAAVQLAKQLDANVTGVCSTRNVDLVASLGADQVIDYTAEDFTQTLERYDCIFDAVGISTYRRCRPALTPDGIYLTTAPSAAILFQTLLTAKLGSRTAKIMFAGLDRTPGKLDQLKHFAETGALRPVIDRHYPLHQIADAHRYVDTARKTGTVVLTPSHDTATPTPGQE